MIQMNIKKALANLTLAAAIGGGALMAHSQSADAANSTSWSYEDECIEQSCSNGEVEEFHEEYENESLVEWGTGNLEEDMELGSDQSNRRNRACSTATMLSDFMGRLGRRVDTEDWLHHYWVCQNL
jgi:hypothetical protein